MLTVLATIGCLWLDLGSDAYWLLQGSDADSMELLTKALSGPGSNLSLPLLAALPCAARAHLEFSCGAWRMVVFRCGHGRYIAAKLLSVLLTASLSQALGILTLTILLVYLCPTAYTDFPISMLAARVLTAMVFSAVGGASALFMKDTVCAYAVPTALSFSLGMLASRFLPSLPLLNPATWLLGSSRALLLLVILMMASAALYVFVLWKEEQYAA